MLKVFLPSNNENERRYAAEILFGEILQLEFGIHFHDKMDTLLLLPNGKRLLIEDHFFNQHSIEKSYLQEVHLPGTVSLVSKKTNPFLVEDDLTIIFGNEKLHISENEIACGVDVLASSFLMLSRWEEYVQPIRDKHGRFPATESLAQRFNFLHRPIVNEYAEMVWNILVHLGWQQPRKYRRFELILTHDVDFPLLWSSFPFFMKKLGGDILKRRSWKEARFSLGSYFDVALGKGKDPYDTFDALMDLSEKHGLRSHFFFQAGGKSPRDTNYSLSSPFLQELLSKILSRGHIIGIHPGYETATDGIEFKRQIELLQKVSPQSVTCGRQHFLRFEAPATWQIWEDKGLEWDSTLGYPERAGFRCGTCFSFPVFNFLTRKKLALLEKPLIVMDTTYAVYRKASLPEAREEISNLVETVKKYRGDFVLLWHNSSFHAPPYLAYRGLYEEILQCVRHLSS